MKNGSKSSGESHLMISMSAAALGAVQFADPDRCFQSTAMQSVLQSVSFVDCYESIWTGKTAFCLSQSTVIRIGRSLKSNSTRETE